MNWRAGLLAFLVLLALLYVLPFLAALAGGN